MEFPKYDLAQRQKEAKAIVKLAGVSGEINGFIPTTILFANRLGVSVYDAEKIRRMLFESIGDVIDAKDREWVAENGRV